MEVSSQPYVPAALTLTERASGTHWIGGWVGPGVGLDAMKKRKISFSCLESNPGHPARSLDAIPTELSGLRYSYQCN
jgi:hypothetical protein